MRAGKLIVICGFVLFLAAILSAGYILFLRPLTLPVYRLEQKMSDHVDFMATTLTLGEKVYISDYSEVPLEIMANWIGKQRMIGRTQDGMEIYAIPRQDPRNYIMLTTEMFPMMVFRAANITPVELASFPADEIQVQTTGKKTREPAIIKEVVAALIRREGMIQGGQPVQSANIHLVSDRLPGLGYAVYGYVDQDGKVYLAERLAPDDWIPAGPEFTKWFSR